MKPFHNKVDGEEASGFPWQPGASNLYTVNISAGSIGLDRPIRRSQTRFYQ